MITRYNLMSLSFNVTYIQVAITLPLTVNQANTDLTNIYVDWGDGTYINSYSHSYLKTGQYTVSIIYAGSTPPQTYSYGFGAMSYPWGWPSGSHFLTAVVSWDTQYFKNFINAFTGCSNLVSVPNTINLDPRGVSLQGMFANCNKFNDPNVLSWDTTNVSDMTFMFLNSSSFSQNLSKWNILPKLPNMLKIVDGTKGAVAPNTGVKLMTLSFNVTDISIPINLPLTGDKANLTNIYVDWGDGGITNTYSHSYLKTGQYTVSIYYAGSTPPPVYSYGFGSTSSNVNWSSGGQFLTAVVSWDTRYFNSFINAFNGCSNLVSVPNTINLDPRGVSLQGMFAYCNKFNDPNVLSWDTTNVSDMSYMFLNSSNFSQNLSNWNSKNVIYMGMDNMISGTKGAVAPFVLKSSYLTANGISKFGFGGGISKNTILLVLFFFILLVVVLCYLKKPIRLFKF